MVAAVLRLKPNCELCDKDLPPDATDAMICSYECTFCKSCVEHTLENVCSNCGGGFTPRPIRPQINRRNGNYLGRHPASTERVQSKVDNAELERFVASVRDIPPEQR